jgi:hypothetical protein
MQLFKVEGVDRPFVSRQGGGAPLSSLACFVPRAANMFFGGYGGFYDFDGDDGGSYGRYKRKSGAAERRESQARDAFTKALMETPIPISSTTVANLLKPSCHLTSASWIDFSKWVKSHQGCSAKRRAATEEEKRAHKETRKVHEGHGVNRCARC